ncbi:MAG: YbaK/EbsC family protein [Halofilum sp. (in: g-proteobacteria)]|nr:YbaK/EbsC family protein [Halofilum sp. (in: g-proteobacteria)]
MPIDRIREFLDEHGVRYSVSEHAPAYTSQEVAAEAHVPGRHFAKTVTVSIDGRLAMAVLPATDQVDLQRLARSVGAEDVRLATEEEFGDRFPGCELGAMPPFGNLFDMEVFVSPHLAEADEIAFNAGSHTEVMRLPYRDFARLVNPAVVHVS